MLVYVITIVLFSLGHSDTFGDPIMVSVSDGGSVQSGDNMIEEPSNQNET